MNNLGLLMKINILNTIKYNELKNGDKKEKNKAIGMALLIALTAVILGVLGFSICFYLSDFLYAGTDYFHANVSARYDNAHTQALGRRRSGPHWKRN